MMDVFARLASVAAQTGPRLVARPVSRYERAVEGGLPLEIDLEVDAAWPPRPRRSPAETDPALRADGAEAVHEQPRAVRLRPQTLPPSDPSTPATSQIVEPELRRERVAEPARNVTVSPPERRSTEPEESPDQKLPVEHTETLVIGLIETAPPGALPSPDQSGPARPPNVGDEQEHAQAPVRVTDRIGSPTAHSAMRTPTRSRDPEHLAGPPPEQPSDTAPITVTIGRIELRTVEAPAPRPRPIAPAAPITPLRFSGPTLDEFLAGGSGGPGGER